MRLAVRLVIIVLAIAAATLALPGVSLAATVTDTFPDQPFNSLQVYYSVSGVSVGAPTDTQDFTTMREYKGKTDSNNIHVTGEFRFVGGTGDNTHMNCEVGLYTVPWWSGDAPEPLGTEFSQWYMHGDSVPFDIWLNVPQDQEEVQVIIDLEGSYANWQDRSVVVKFKLQNIYYDDGSGPTATPDSGSSGDDLAMSPLPLIGAGMIACLYAVYRANKKR